MAGRIDSKEKEFKTEKAMLKFIDKLKDKDNFYRILAYSNPC
jgi:hypothetical protein